MRFIEQGPDIPDELLEARDRGEVVFICGAGVSMPAGLPSFLTLAKQVVADLGVSQGHGAHVLLDQIITTNGDFQPPIDQVFSRLKKDYGPLVQEAVFKRLKIKRNTPLDKHKLLLDLSSDSNGEPRLVTTNFDFLFELAKKGIRKYVAPELPDLSVVQVFSGVVYLHGRMPKAASEQNVGSQIVLSSSDFGRAYLAQGWATRFVRDLLQRFTVVLLGYSATDPPIRYLLEGLETSVLEDRHRIYAFEAGIPNMVTANWRDRNVRGIAYEKVDDNHSGLWASIEKWAERARNPVGWRTATVELALKGPRNLSSFQRGQVVSLVSSIDGAKVFAEKTPPVSPEWLCVFDRNIRYLKPAKEWNYGNDEPVFDAQLQYGLNGDPPRAEEQDTGSRRAKQTGADPIASIENEKNPNNYRRLTNLRAGATAQTSPRLFYLTNWIAKTVGNPITPWWVGKQLSLHPELSKQIEFGLNRLDLGIAPIIRETWNYILEAFGNGDREELQYRWFDIAEMIKSSGWSTHVLRELERFLIPKLAIEHSALANSKPIFPSLDQIRIKHIVNLKVDFPDFHDGLHKIEDQFLPLVIQMARRGLERGSKLLGEIDRYTRETPTLFPETMEGTHYHDARAKYFLWFGNLFQRLVILNPKSGAKEFEQWPSNEFHFDKLKLFALSFSKAFGPKEVINHLKSLNAAVFWDGGHVRELLLLLQKRWTEMSRQQRITVCKIILRGPAIWQDEDKKGYKRRLIVTKLEILVWLDEQGCQLPKFVHPEIKKLKLALPAWKDSWAETVANSREPRSGWVKTETDATGLKGLPISKIVEAATQQSKRTFAEFVEHKPFQGLTTDKSFLALAALSSSARSGNYPTLLWQELLSSWPKELSPRLNCLLALRLAKLPPNVAHELRHYLPRWLEEHLPALAKKNQASAIDIWNRCLDSLVKTGSISTESSIGDAFVGGKKVMRSRRTFYHSSGPVGTFGDTIFKILDDLKLGKGKGIPASIRAGIERLWETPGEGADQALAITGRRLLWLDHIDPKWVKSKLLPHFALTSPNAEPAWSGYLHLQALPHQQLFALLKRDFVGLIEKMKQWQWGDDEQSEYSFLVVLACWWNQKDQKYTDWNMTRSILKLLDDSPRARAIYTVSQISFGKSAWKSFGKQFFERAWPKETAIQSNNTSTALVNLAEQADSLFPEVVKVISKFVYPLDHPDLFIFKMKKEGKKQSPELATRFPMSVLELLDRLVPIDRNYPPYDLSPLLNMMADANPKIRQDRRWLRLRRLVDAN